MRKTTVTPAEQAEPWRDRAITVTFTTDEYRRLIDAASLAALADLTDNADLPAFVRRSTMDKVALIERLGNRGDAA